MSYKLFLLEREVGYQITAETNGLILMQRLRMLDRYWLEEKKAYDNAQSKSSNKKSELLK